MRECITHHHACPCREAKYTMDMALLKAENTALREVARAARELRNSRGTIAAALMLDEALARLDKLTGTPK